MIAGPHCPATFRKPLPKPLGGGSSTPRSRRASAWRRAPPTRSRSSALHLSRAAPTSTTASARRLSNVSSPRRVGLPESLRMRHDPHFVDQLGRPGGVAIGRVIPIEDIEPNPRQPRQNLGDLSELTASIREKGVLEPILVRQNGARYQIIAGERRFRAASEAGLAEMPCIVRDSTDAEMIELALVENLQRKDLTAFEEAEGLKALAEIYQYTHERMAQQTGNGN